MALLAALMPLEPENMLMSQEMTREEMLAMLKAMQEQNADLAAKLASARQPKALTMKVGEKGGLSVYGLGKWPVTLYVQQWERLLDARDTIIEYINANRKLLKD